jgi:hypothetical protein
LSLRESLTVAGKLLVASLILGLVLAYFDLSPRRLLCDIPDVLGDALHRGVWLVQWAVPYVLLGATIVIPVWAVLALLRRFKK